MKVDFCPSRSIASLAPPLATHDGHIVEQTISIEVLLFQAALFALPASGIRAGSVIAVPLVPASNGAR
jgi:hypothetical protein